MPHPIITARKRSLGQGNVFTAVCHSVHREGVSLTETPLNRDHQDRSHWTETPLDRDPPTVMIGRHTLYWSVFLFGKFFAEHRMKMWGLDVGATLIPPMLQDLYSSFFYEHTTLAIIPYNGPNRNVLLQTHLLFVTIYGLMWSSFHIRWHWSIWKSPITARDCLKQLSQAILFHRTNS